jgi:hypothetical protein
VIRRLLILVAALPAILAVPATAGAVTIQDFPIEPGAAPGVQLPTYLKAGPDGNLWIVNDATSGDIQRITPSGQRLAPIASENPEDLAVGPSGTVYWTEGVGADGLGGIAKRAPDATVQSFRPGFAFGLAFSVRLNGRNLQPGTYRASAVATDAVGNASAPSRVSFTVRSR